MSIVKNFAMVPCLVAKYPILQLYTPQFHMLYEYLIRKCNFPNNTIKQKHTCNATTINGMCGDIMKLSE